MGISSLGEVSQASILPHEDLRGQDMFPPIFPASPRGDTTVRDSGTRPSTSDTDHNGPRSPNTTSRVKRGSYANLIAQSIPPDSNERAQVENMLRQGDSYDRIANHINELDMTHADTIVNRNHVRQYVERFGNEDLLSARESWVQADSDTAPAGQDTGLSWTTIRWAKPYDHPGGGQFAVDAESIRGSRSDAFESVLCSVYCDCDFCSRLDRSLAHGPLA